MPPQLNLETFDSLRSQGNYNPAGEPLADRGKRKCRFCGTRLNILQRASGASYCSKVHEETDRQRKVLKLARLLNVEDQLNEPQPYSGVSDLERPAVTARQSLTGPAHRHLEALLPLRPNPATNPVQTRLGGAGINAVIPVFLFPPCLKSAAVALALWRATSFRPQRVEARQGSLPKLRWESRPWDGRRPLQAFKERFHLQATLFHAMQTAPGRQESAHRSPRRLKLPAAVGPVTLSLPATAWASEQGPARTFGGLPAPGGALWWGWPELWMPAKVTALIGPQRCDLALKPMAVPGSNCELAGWNAAGPTLAMEGRSGLAPQLHLATFAQGRIAIHGPRTMVRAPHAPAWSAPALARQSRRESGPMSQLQPASFQPQPVAIKPPGRLDLEPPHTPAWRPWALVFASVRAQAPPIRQASLHQAPAAIVRPDSMRGQGQAVAVSNAIYWHRTELAPLRAALPEVSEASFQREVQVVLQPARLEAAASAVVWNLPGFALLSHFARPRAPQPGTLPLSQEPAAFAGPRQPKLAADVFLCHLPEPAQFAIHPRIEFLEAQAQEPARGARRQHAMPGAISRDALGFAQLSGHARTHLGQVRTVTVEPCRVRPPAEAIVCHTPQLTMPSPCKRTLLPQATFQPETAALQEQGQPEPRGESVLWDAPRCGLPASRLVRLRVLSAVFSVNARASSSLPLLTWLRPRYLQPVAALLVLCAALGFALSTKSGDGKASGERDWLRQAIAQRASLEVNDNFASGLQLWQGGQNWSRSWSADKEGFVRTGQLALWRPTAGLADYHLEFLAQIEKKGVGWVFRAKDPKNYYAVKLSVTTPLPRPVVSLVRYPVIDGRKGPPVLTPLSIMMHRNTPYRVALDVRGSRLAVSVEGQEVDSWADDRLQRGGVGFFSDNGERARLYWVRVSNQTDWLGRLCASLAGGEHLTDASPVTK